MSTCQNQKMNKWRKFGLPLVGIIFILNTSALLWQKNPIEVIKQTNVKWEKNWKVLEKFNPPPIKVKDTLYIVIHSTSVDANADAVCNSMGCREATWHYTVDENKIINSLPLHFQSWHIGDKSPLSNARNKNSISIEMCQHSKQSVSKVINNTGTLLIFLKYELRGLYPNCYFKVISHSQATGKACPLLIRGETISMFKWIIEGQGLSLKEKLNHNRLREKMKSIIKIKES